MQIEQRRKDYRWHSARPPPYARRRIRQGNGFEPYGKLVADKWNICSICKHYTISTLPTVCQSFTEKEDFLNFFLDYRIGPVNNFNAQGDI